MACLQLAAQDHGNQELSSKMKTLQLLVGKWQGEGYIIDQSRQKTNFQQEELIEYDLDSTILSIEGVGKSDGKIVHHARAIISPSDTSGKFEFYSFLSDGRKGKFMMEQEGEVIKWFIETEQGTIRYTITLSKNNYHEIGEFGYGDGNWYPFLEMNLKRVKS